MAEKLEELSVNDDKTKSSEDNKEEVKKEEKKAEVKEEKKEKAGEEEKKWAQERCVIRILHLPFSPFLQQTLKIKFGHFFSFLASWIHKTLVPLLMRPFSLSSSCCDHLSHSQTLISPFIFSYIVDQSSAIMYLCIDKTCYDTRLVLLIDSHIG